MAGDRLAALAQRLLRADTFALVAGPAIADLQFEAPSASRRQLLCHYAGVWRALGSAITQDAIDGVPTFVGLVLLQACYYTGLLMFVGGLTGVFDLRVALPKYLASLTAAQLFGVLSVIALLSVVPVAACFWSRERA
jgi:hypothetical protein